MRFLHSFMPFWLCVTTVTALPFLESNVTDFKFLPGSVDSLSSRGLANDVQLRIMCLGASITYGYLSTDGNGFRYALRNVLVYNGNPVNMVGSVHAGTMADNDVEGWGGYIISQMQAKAALTVPSQPNIVLIHVGTNDMLGNVDYTNAHVRLGELIDYIFDSIPGVTVIASTLLPLADAASEYRREYYNSQIPGMVELRQKAGKKITYVDFGSSWFNLADINDGIHPTEAGYQKMAAVWYEGLLVAQDAGFITPPATVPGVSDVVTAGETCDKIPGNILGPYQIQFGSGVNDGPYVHVGTSVGGFYGFNNPASVGFDNPLPEGVYWADINGDGIDDYVYVAINSNGGFGVALSLGGGNLGPYLWYAFSISCARTGVRFADMTGDGRDDFCCIAANGDLSVWQNTPGTDARSPLWVAQGTIKAGTGFPQAQVHLADIDGDGRADYVGISADGTTIWGWRNGATSNGQVAYWTPFGGVFFGLPALSLSGWRFVDLNGDHRDDLVHVDVNGQVTTWINQRGFDGGALTPAWQSMGVTHGGASSPRNVTFGAFMGSGRADYSTITPAANWSELSVVYVDRYQNNDYGGIRTKGDGDRYCDMTGDGSDDYIWLSFTGDVTVYGNLHSPGTWKQWGQIYSTGAARRDIRFADFNGDGKCDILIVNAASGATTVLQNNYANGAFSFTNMGVVTGSATCTEGYGYMDHDIGVHWNDLNGDGRADFLCMQQNGVITGYLNEGIGNMVYQGQIKHKEGKERKDFRIADMDGDGKDDLVWLDQRTGQLSYWKNMGPSSSPIPATGSDSAFGWLAKGVSAQGGQTRGAAIELANMNGLGRADYITINPQENFAWVLYNICPNGGLAPVTPNLPTGAPPAPAFPIGGTPTSTTTTSQPTPSGGNFLQAPDPNCLATNACSTCTVQDDDNKKNDERWTAGGVDAFLQTANAWYASQMALSADDSVLDNLRGKYDQALIWNYRGTTQGLEGWECGVIGNTQCGKGGTYSCAVLTVNNGVGAMALVMESWANVFNFYNNMWDAVANKEVAILSRASEIVAVFSPSTEASDSTADSILKVLGYVDDILGFAGADFWSKLFKKPETFDNFKDSVEKTTSYTANVEGFVTYLGTYSSDKIPAFQQEFDKDNSLSAAIGYLGTTFQSLIHDYLEHLFDGTPDGMTQLAREISSGFFLTDPFSESSDGDSGVYAFYDSIDQAFYAKLIPIAWRLDPDVWPVLIARDIQPTDTTYVTNPVNDVVQPPDRGFLFADQILADDDAEASRVLYGGTTFWLLDLHTCEPGPLINRPTSCSGQVFRALPGIASVNGDGTYANVTKEDMVESAYTGYLANENYPQNDYGLVPQGDDVTDPADITALPYQNGFTTPGFYNFPICDISTAFRNWAYYFNMNITEAACDYYPCCPDPYS